jgi:transcription initiation factor TFIID subunit 2
MPEVTNFCLPGLLAYLKHTSAFLHDVFEFYEEHLSCRYPYTQYKQVFVDEAYDVKMTYASMAIFK